LYRFAVVVFVRLDSGFTQWGWQFRQKPTALLDTLG
jgi:hypothetical protein